MYISLFETALRSCRPPLRCGELFVAAVAATRNGQNLYMPVFMVFSKNLDRSRGVYLLDNVGNTKCNVQANFEVYVIYRLNEQC